MHKPLFPPVLEDWLPSAFPRLPLPYWMTHSPSLPEGVSRGQALGVIQAVWGRKLAEGMAKRGGLTPGTSAWETFVDNMSQAVSAGLLGS